MIAKSPWDWDELDLGMSRFQGRSLWRAASGADPSASLALEALGAFDGERASGQGPWADAALGFSRWGPFWRRVGQHHASQTRWIAQSLSLLIQEENAPPKAASLSLCALCALWIELPQALPAGSGLACAGALSRALREGLDSPHPQWGARREALFARRCVEAAREGLRGPSREEALLCAAGLDGELCAKADYAPLTQAVDLFILESMNLSRGSQGRGGGRL